MELPVERHPARHVDACQAHRESLGALKVIWIAVALLVLLLGLGICIAIFAALWFGQMRKDIGFKLPSFNLFTGRWSDEDKQRDGTPPEG